MDIREIEIIIDHLHENNPLFGLGRDHACMNLLVTFQDLCSLAAMGSVLNPFALSKIRDYMDALNIALKWCDDLCEWKDETFVFSEEDYLNSVDLLNNYALPYSDICSGYIAYSRNRLNVNIDGNVVEFISTAQQNDASWADILREISNSDLDQMLLSIQPAKLILSTNQFAQYIFFEDNQICYSLNEDIIDAFRDIALKQWNTSKTLPDNWAFDRFTMAEYKNTWVALSMLSYIHFFACMKIEDPIIRWKNCIIMKERTDILGILSTLSGIDIDKVGVIIDYITYNHKKRNRDIMYQPIVALKQDIIITPFLFMGANPERNLLALVNSGKDREHSREVNNLENYMVQELEEVLPNSENVIIAKHKDISVSDVDLAILDKVTHSAIVCELKWFTAADSTAEVYAREDDISHGCEQIETIMTYAMQSKKQFMHKLFGIEDGEDVDLFCCVIAKHNIRTYNKYVPVIDIKRAKELLVKYPLNSVFHMIRNHEYEIEMNSSWRITYKEVLYGDFVFKIPAICIDGDIEEDIV